MSIRIGIVLFTWALAYLIFRYNKTVPFLRWLSLVIFIAGSTTFATCIQLYLLPFLWENHPHWHGIIAFLQLVSAVFAYFCIYFFPYAVLISCIEFSKLFTSKCKIVLKLLLLAPILPLSLSDQAQIYPVIAYDFAYINMYTGIYILTGCILLVVSILRREADNDTQKNRRLTVYFYIPMLIWISFTNYINVKKFWLNETGFHVDTIYLDINEVKNIFYTVCYILILFYIYFSSKHGLFGIKLRVERQKFDHTMRTISVGTNFLNHTIKNEIQKLNYLGNRTQDYIHANDKDRALHTVDSMFHVILHMQNMVERIKEMTEEIVLQETPESLVAITESILTIVKPMMEKKNITLETAYLCDAHLYCDRLHLGETISNIIMNAYEAVKAQTGLLEIRLFRTKKEIVIEFKDNGCGIATENILKVFNPFFTTKKSPSSYGLGLSYCYAVLQKHQGKLEIASDGPDKGTTVTLKLPVSRIVH